MPRRCVGVWNLWCAAMALGIFGCGEAPKPTPGPVPALGDPAVKNAPPATSPVAATEKPSAPQPEPAAKTEESESDEEAPDDMDDDVQATLALMKKDPSELSREELVSVLIKWLQRGIAKVNNDDREAGNAAILEAVKYTQVLKERFPESTDFERRVSSVTFLFQAGVLAQGDAPGDAAPAILQAVELGFDDFERLDADKELEKLRALPDYAQWRKDWEAKAAEIAKADVLRELASFESYPFDFALPDLDEKEVKLADYKDKVVIVDFWGTWCPPCRQEIPSFVALQEKYGAQGLQIIGLNFEGTEKPEEAVAQIREFMESQPINYPCLIAEEGLQKQLPKFEGFPTTLFIDRTGKVRLQYIGLHSLSRLETTVLALLNEEGTKPAEPAPAQ